MSRAELLPLLIILVYLQPWCVSCQRYLNPKAFVAISQKRNNHNNLPLLRDASDRLWFLMWNPARWRKLPTADEPMKLWNSQYETRESLDGAEMDTDSWPKTALGKYETASGDTDVEMLTFKRQSRNCDSSQITLQTLIEYLRTGRICGRRVAHVRFGLGGRRR